KSTIQAGINAAMDGDTVLVKYGVYSIINTIDYFGKNIRLASDDGTHTTYETATKDASCCFIDANSGECQVFYLHWGETSDAVLAGFTIENGIDNNGGGIHCRNASPTITNCIIKNNSADHGGGIFCGNSSPTINNCTISNNLTSYDTDNTGGGIVCYNSSPNIINCNIIKNKTCFGGGIYCTNNSSPNIINCIIRENLAKGCGGGIRCFESSPTITNCTIIQNLANYGGGIACKSSSPGIINCTISDNTANYNGGGIYCNFDSPAITNCVLWGNLPDEISGSTVIITYSDIQGGYGDPNTAHNINAEPLFIDPNAGDYRLWFASPCIDAGDPNAPTLPPTDKDGNPRIINGKPDMGAYEYMELLTLYPGLNLVSFPQGLEWGYLMDNNVPIVKIQAYQPKTLSWLTLAPSDQGDFSFSLVRGWLVYVSQDKPDNIDLRFPFISSTSGFNPAEDLFPGMNLLDFYSLYEMLTIQYSQQLIWPKNVFQRLNQKTGKDTMCIVGYDRREGKWQATYPFFGHDAGFTTKLKKEGYVAYFK
ncbi:MAG: right-handed parallel beta-helix repeat-containing protein, partial [bacterium]